MACSCVRHHLQGVWGAARPPSGERQGQSPLAPAHAPRLGGEREARGAAPTRNQPPKLLRRPVPGGYNVHIQVPETCSTYYVSRSSEREICNLKSTIYN